VASSTNFWVTFFLPFVQYDHSISVVCALVLFITDATTSSSSHTISSSIYFLLHKYFLLNNKSRLLLFHSSIFHTSTTFHLYITQHVQLCCATYFYSFLWYVNILHISPDAFLYFSRQGVPSEYFVCAPVLFIIVPKYWKESPTWMSPTHKVNSISLTQAQVNISER
jgi:hypothetical protein